MWSAIRHGERHVQNACQINYFIADKYLLAFTEIVRSPNQKVLMLPIEAASVLRTLVSIAEIVNATFIETPSSIRGSAPPQPTVPALARNP
jgi:hypothetical protein